MSSLISQAGTGSGPTARSPGLARRLAALFICLGLLALLVAGVAPRLPGMVGVEARHQYLIDSGIEAGAYFYTGVERVPQAESLADAALRSVAIRAGTTPPAAAAR